MAKEIERKFLVTGDFEPFVTRRTHIIQGYLCKDPDRTVRIRIRDNHGFITVKTRNHGCERNEWEYELPTADTPFERPSWLGEEVTGDKRYYNSNL